MPTVETSAISEQDVSAIKSITDVHRRALIAHDPDAFIATCAEDIVFTPPNEAPVVGQAACRAWLEAFPRASEMTVGVQEVEGRADLAFSRGEAVGTMEDGTTSTFQFMAIHRKQPDGSWKMTRDIFNMKNAVA